MSQIACNQSRAFFNARSLFSSRAFFLACALAAAVGCDVADSSSVETDDESIASVDQALVDGYSLSSPPATVVQGSNISVNFVAPAGHSQYDWIAIYLTGGSVTQYVAWAYVGAGTSGTLNITLPANAQPGQSYEIRYMLANYTHAASSTSFVATEPATAYTFPNGPYTTPPGQFWVEWAAPSNHSANDWIGLYRVGTSAQYYSYAFVGSAGATDGVVSLTMPSNAQPGDQYEVRYMLAAGGIGGRSTPFSSGNLITAPASPVAVDTDFVTTWTAPANHATNDWIGLVPVDALSTDFIAYAYVGAAGQTTGNVTIHMPATAPDGEYELRYFLNNTYEIGGVSPKFEVGFSVGVTAPASAVAGTVINVPWSAPANHATTDWIGLYPVGAGAGGFAAFAYVGAAGQKTGSVNISIPASASGNYELRYSVNNTYTVTATSAQFPITQ